VAYRAYHAVRLRDVDAAVTVAVVVVAPPDRGYMEGTLRGRWHRGGSRGSLCHGDGAEQHRASHCAGTNCTSCDTTGRGK